MIGVLAVLIGLCAGAALNVVIDKQADGEDRMPPRCRAGVIEWLPLIGPLRRQAWVALAVEIITALMALVLWWKYGLSTRTLVLFVASLVLIDTGAVDFRIRLIDPLVLLPATAGAVLCAPLIGLSWINSTLGLAVAGILFLFFFVLAKLMFPGVAAPFGLGDVYLAAFIGALVGFFDLPPALFYGIALAGLVAFVLILVRISGRTIPTYIAYGTYLCLGALLFLAVGG